MTDLDPRRLADTAARTALVTAGLVPGVASSLLRNRSALLAALGQLPTDPTGAIPRLIAPGLDGLGERLVRATLALLDDEAVRGDLMSVAQHGSGSVAAVQPVLDVLQRTVVDPIVTMIGIPDARLRASLVAAVLGGLIGARSVVQVEPLASATPDQIVALLAPGIQRLLDPTQSAS